MPEGVICYEAMRDDDAQPHAGCFACKQKPVMELPGFCTNCGEWFDRALMATHCKAPQEPPSWTEIRRALDHHQWGPISKIRRALNLRSRRDDDYGDWNVARPPVEKAAKDREGWVYRLWNAAGILLYIGMTRRKPEKRLDEHRRAKEWWPDVARIDVIPCPDEHEAAKEEKRQIQALRPLHNIVHNAGVLARA